MKVISSILTTIVMSAACVSLSAQSLDIIENTPQTSPTAVAQSAGANTNASQTTTAQNSNKLKSAPQGAARASRNSKAIQVIAPQDGLETAIRNSEQGDLLLLGPDGWYRIEAKTVAQGTRMFVLSAPGSEVSAFPKQKEKSQSR